MAELVPQQTSIVEVYSDSGKEGLSSEHELRWINLLAKFKSTYGHGADFVARSPGRVNIIGEHVDYSLFNVLPAAVTVDALVAVKVVPTRQAEAHINVANVLSDKYRAQKINVPYHGEIEIDSSKHEWTNYFKAGLKGALEFLRKNDKDFVPASMEVLMDGNVPAGGGLSSSAAFVCASALAIMKANKHDVSKQDLLDLAIVSERAVGVHSGGMDQAASVHGEKGQLVYCRFFPSFTVEHVPVPKSEEDFAFLIAQSFVTSDKAVTAPKHYNLRVVECTLAAVVLAKSHDLALSPDESPLKFSLRNVMQESMKKEGRLQEPLENQLAAMIEMTEKELTNRAGYTRQEVAQLLGISVQTLEERYLSEFHVEADRFQLQSRALHVFEEAGRVLTFKAELTHAHGLNKAKLERLGNLMNETQKSCSGLYDCSCPEIEDICRIARSAGAYGSRLTGAGWGGCTVHLVPRHKLDAVVGALRREYYAVKFPAMTEDKLKEALVISKPGQGSSIIAGAALEG